MTLWVTYSHALINVERDAQLATRIRVRKHAGADFEPLNTCTVFRAFVAQRADQSDEALIAELLTLRRMHQDTHYALWFLAFAAMPSFLVRLHLRAGQMRSKDRHGAALRAALAHAQAALGFGKRGKGRARKVNVAA